MNRRTIDVIRADLDQMESRVLDNAFSEDQKIAFGKLCGSLRYELNRERSRIYKKRQVAKAMQASRTEALFIVK